MFVVSQENARLDGGSVRHRGRTLLPPWKPGRLPGAARAWPSRAVDPTRFVTDASLELVARRLRFLGYDVASHRGARLEELFDVAAREGRTVLTLSERHPRQWAHVAALRLPRGETAAALRQVVEGHAPAGAPFSRCPHCNVALRPRSAFEAVGEVPPRVARRGGPFTWCPACGRWYWPGSHVARIVEWLEAATGRAVAVPGAERFGPPGPDAPGTGGGPSGTGGPGTPEP